MKMTMRTKIIYLLLLGMLLCTLFLTGCQNSASAIVLQSKLVRVNVDDPISTELSDYVKASKTILSEMTLDLSSVDTKTIGRYKAYVNYQKATAHFTVEVTDLKAPVIHLKADRFYLELSGNLKLEDVVESVTDYSDCTYGFSDDMTLADDKKTLLSQVSVMGQGEYRYEILARDAYGNCSVKEFTVAVVAEGEAPSDATQVESYTAFMNQNKGEELGDLNAYSDQVLDYGVGTGVDDKNRPELSYYQNAYEGKFAVDFIQPDSRYVFLTFNCMYERGYTAAILDTLKEKKAHAVFFVTKEYMEENPELIKRMIEEGHVLGNQTATGVTVGTYMVNELTTEINLLYNYAHENYGYDMYLFRAPSGNFSERTLAVAQSLGYRTVFWSFAYADWNADQQPDVTEALQNAKNRLHGGEIFSLSSGSSTNAAMLGDLIDAARAQGFEFAIYQKI